MIPVQTDRQVITSPIVESAEFGISTKDTAHIMQILRDQLYSDKILAVLREYGSNAWDANRENGKADVPIHVTLPTIEDSVLRIRDFGKGLSPEEVFNVYTQYGASTKRNTDLVVGMLGIGSKSGFAYADSFTVTSYYGGVKSVYVALLDESEKGRIDLLHTEASSEETGVEIAIAVDTSDFSAFVTKAEKVFRHFTPLPVINTPLKYRQESSLLGAYPSGKLYEKTYGEDPWEVIMGCIAYPINLEQLRTFKTETGEQLSPVAARLHGRVTCDVGTIQISASREHLKYSNTTKTVLIRTINRLVDEFVSDLLDGLKADSSLTPWARRLKAVTLDNYGIPSNTNIEHLRERYVDLLAPKDADGRDLFVVGHPRAGRNSTTLRVNTETRLVLVDTTKNIAGYGSLGTHTTLIIPAPNVSLEKVSEALASLLAEMACTGIPIQYISQFPWVSPTKQSRGPTNEKHSRHLFAYSPGTYWRSPASKNWDIVEKVPEAEDVFVILENFEAKGLSFREEYRNDLQLAEYMKVPMPVVYGYRNTTRKPVTAATVTGRHYLTWQKQFRQSFITERLLQLYSKLQWSKLPLEGEGYGLPRISGKYLDLLVFTFGKDHPLVLFCTRVKESREYFKQKTNSSDCTVLELLERNIKEHAFDNSAKDTEAVLLKKYPLLEITPERFSALWLPDDKGSRWRAYVKERDILCP